MNPKAQLRYLMELTFFDQEKTQPDVKESLLLGVVGYKNGSMVLSDGINSIDVPQPKNSVNKKKQKTEDFNSLEPNSLYVFKDCSMKMHENGDEIDFELSYKSVELIMPYYFVTKEKNFKPLNIDLSMRDHNMLKRKVN